MSITTKAISETGKLEFTITESDSKHTMDAEARILEGRPADGTYDLAKLETNGVEIGYFDALTADGKASFEFFSGVENTYTVLFYKDGVEVGAITDKFKYNIQTWFLKVGDDYNLSNQKDAIDGGTLWVYATNVSAGSNDKIFVINARVPEGESLTVAYSSASVADPSPHHGGAVGAMHYRKNDYRNRWALYTDPDEPQYHIDPETEKWIFAPLTIGAGAEEVYICPSNLHDKTLVTVNYSGSRAGMMKIYSDSIFN